MTEEKKYCVYMHTNKINGKKYIGLTSQPPEWRWGINGIKYMSKDEAGDYKQPAFAYALKKYNNWDEDWEHTIIADKLSYDEASQMEIDLIAFYKTNICRWGEEAMGYNLTDGGGGTAGHSLSEDTRRKISEKLTGKVFPEERKQKYSIMFSGKNNPMYGRPWWDENTPKEKIEQWRLNLAKYGEENHFYGKHHTDESKAKLSETRDKTPVVQLDMNGKFIAEYESATEAMRITGISSGNILGCCYDYCKSAGGFIWVLRENYDVNKTYIYQDNSKRPVVQLDLYGNFISEYVSVNEASRITGVDNAGIYRACTNDNWTAGGFIWVFKKDYDSTKSYVYTNNNYVAVVCFDINNNYICEYESVTAAHNATSADCSAIIRCCKDKQKTAGGFKWKYKKDWIDLINEI